MNAQELFLKDGKETGIFFCEKCRIVSRDKDSADKCCSPCCSDTCGKETERYWTPCSECRAAKSRTSFLAKEPIDWDGKTPLTIHDSDEYFFDEESLIDYLYDNLLNVNEVLLELCEPQYGQPFCLVSHLEDALPTEDDFYLDDEGKAVEKAVNDWIEKQGALSWIGSGQRINPESLKDIQKEVDERVGEDSEESLGAEASPE